MLRDSFSLDNLYCRTAGEQLQLEKPQQRLKFKRTVNQLRIYSPTFELV